MRPKTTLTAIVGNSEQGMKLREYVDDVFQDGEGAFASEWQD